MIALVIFAAASVAAAYMSRRSLTNARTHGFYRYFAWEFIIALCCLNFVSIEHWFRDAFSFRQIASWILLISSIVPAILATHELRVHGKPDVARRAGPESLLAFESTTELVTTGIFHYLHHPMYCSLLLLAWGVFFKKPDGFSGALALGATAFLVAASRVEESENVRFFGDRYIAYARSTKRFIPWLW